MKFHASNLVTQGGELEFKNYDVEHLCIVLEGDVVSFNWDIVY